MATSITGSGVATPQLSVSGQTTLGSTPNVTTPQSMVQLNTANGYGSTNTMIRRFSNVVVNQGSDITYTDSAVNGASFTVNTSGVYAITYSDNFSSGSVIGLSLNANQLSAAIMYINAANILNLAATTPGNSQSVSWVGYVAAGSVVRAHDAGTAGTLYTFFTMARVA
ncbi:MAG: hypothetical protein JO171_12140 [Paludibacterium sp.]|uniref:hypothetical protein n=1 Tax=Paludibacterium sp. TaxID=1917523 RepID=UPI0025D54C83|nr:hypothetical protein [Paludibacterium sp.]MBV8047901.1 hypothetical protein [Paludibacterium sp.]MBV8647471.1 hypothetical protein [Paludibacterium sp.]